MKQIPVFILICLVASLFSHCNRLRGNSFVPGLPGYMGNEKTSIMLKRPLREISGIDYLHTDTLVAINDELGKLFFMDASTGLFKEVGFWDKDDYEDVVKAGLSYYVINSKGHLFEISESQNKLVTTYTNDFGKWTEFESVCYDRANQQLLLICKECGKNANSINAYRFNLTTKQYVPGIYFSILWTDIRHMAKDNSIECKPSAATFNPINGKLYIIASLGKVLLQCNNNGSLEAVYGLNPDHFPQPEGITFSPAGDLYISNEGIQGRATLLKFAYHP